MRTDMYLHIDEIIIISNYTVVGIYIKIRHGLFIEFVL